VIGAEPGIGPDAARPWGALQACGDREIMAFARALALRSPRRGNIPPPVNRTHGSTDMTQPFRTWMCLICGWIYDEAQGLPEEGIAPGTRWEDIPMNWTCPECGARKEDFEMVEI
jgi:rubredoxin